MLLALSSNGVGLPGLLCDIQQHRRMVECRWADTPNLYAGELHRSAHTANEKSLPLGMSYRRRNDDLPRIYRTTRGKP